MDLTIERHTGEATHKRYFRKVFFILNLPVYAKLLLWIGLLSLLEFIMKDRTYVILCRYFRVFIFLCVIFWYPQNWKLYRNILKKNRRFELPTILHLTDTFLEITFGENHQKIMYDQFPYYILLKDYIALCNHSDGTAGGIERSHFADGGTAFIHRLEASGVKPLPLWSMKRWWKPLSLVGLNLTIAILLLLFRQ